MILGLFVIVAASHAAKNQTVGRTLRKEAMKKDTAFTMRYSQEDAERLNDLAKKMKRSRSDVLRLIVSEALEAISAAQQSVQWSRRN